MTVELAVCTFPCVPEPRPPQILTLHLILNLQHAWQEPVSDGAATGNKTEAERAAEAEAALTASAAAAAARQTRAVIPVRLHVFLRPSGVTGMRNHLATTQQWYAGTSRWTDVLLQSFSPRL